MLAIFSSLVETEWKKFDVRVCFFEHSEEKRNFEHLNIKNFVALFSAHTRNIVKCQFRFAMMAFVSSDLSLGWYWVISFFLVSFFLYLHSCFSFSYFSFLLTSFYLGRTFERQSIKMSNQLLYQLAFSHKQKQHKQKHENKYSTFRQIFFIFLSPEFMNEFIILFFFHQPELVQNSFSFSK